MRVPSTVYLLVGIVLAVFIGWTVATQLTTDASAAAAFCAKAEAQGVPCTVGPKYDAQVVEIVDPTGAHLAYLVISQGTKTVGVLPLQ